MPAQICFACTSNSKDLLAQLRLCGHLVHTQCFQKYLQDNNGHCECGHCGRQATEDLILFQEDEVEENLNKIATKFNKDYGNLADDSEDSNTLKKLLKMATRVILRCGVGMKAFLDQFMMAPLWIKLLVLAALVGFCAYMFGVNAILMHAETVAELVKDLWPVLCEIAKFLAKYFPYFVKFGVDYIKVFGMRLDVRRQQCLEA